ncbi:MAG: hypothetical protein HC877_24225 [Thioploca sp.]|nr:hypothetical protein [Thioploca sp.]
MKKILFLDVDGVLNDAKSRKENNDAMHPIYVRNLERILKETDCYIVVSSSWRVLGMGLMILFSKHYIMQAQILINYGMGCQTFQGFIF